MTNSENYESKRSQAAIDRVRDLVGADRLSVADRIAQLYNEYIALDRDKLLRSALVASIASVTTPITGKPDKRRIVAVCGRSGAGKTTSIVKHIQSLKAMASYFDEDGVRVHPVIFIEAPSPCTPRLLAIAGLEALGHTPPDRIRENEAWLLFRRLLKVHKVMWVVIDEAQHTIESATIREATVIGDAFKNLTQMPDWPVRLILVGVSPLASFLARKQLYNRRTVVPFDNVDAEGNTDLIKSILNTIVLEHAGMELRIHLEEESADDHEGVKSADDQEGENKKKGAFLKRLMHACDAEFGSVVQMIRAAVELAMLDGREHVLLDDFVKTYASFSGCRPSKNVFTAANWQDLDPATALLRDDDRAWEESKLKAKGKNATKYGVRPQ
ncbi:AAA family ATPase [Rhizobium binxianense]|uniref:AAA family ATPase n=1 Tax=Rhizobium binxianense TaxID=3024242 RepID=UPI00236053CE|nr:AAA family ATPase [Rhizobium sp. MJ37]MDC9835712.1 AAA family ATPase [Rhizobium sp. MJ37]